jgi:hypothetical protein
MTPEELHAHLSANPGKSYATLDAEARAIMRSHLRSSPEGFTQQQRDWLKDFYLVVPNQQTFDAIAAALPPSLGLSTRQTLSGVVVLNADLLTDCLLPEDNWGAIAADLAQLEIRFIAPDQFPVAEEP